MANIGFGELILILLAALLLFGPRRLPEIGRALGRGIREFQEALRGVGQAAPAEPEVRAEPLQPMAAPAARPARESQAGSPQGSPREEPPA